MISQFPAVYELLDSGSGSVSNDWESGETREVTRRFLVGRCDGFNGAVTAISAYAPRYMSAGYGPFWMRRNLDVKPVGNLYYEVSATYSTVLPTVDNPSAGAGGGDGGDGGGDGGDGGGGGAGGGSTNKPLPGGIAWDTTGGTAHITQAYSTSSYGTNPPDIYDAINISGDSVNGIDVVRPSLRYSETWIVPSALATNGAFVSGVYQLTGTVNLTKFRIFEPGEALFMGARCQWQGGEPFVPITFDFECRPNDDDHYVNGITGVSKEGWQHLWIMYETQADTDTLVKMPKYAFVQTVYEKKDWSPLLIPGISPAQPKTPRPPREVQAEVASFLGS